MKIESKQFVEVVGILAVVFSLLFVGYELRLARSIAESETYAEGAELSRNMREYISDNSDVWARGCMGEELSPSEAVQFTSMVLEFINYQYYRWNRAGVGITFEAGRINAPQDVARNIYNFPGIYSVWEGGRIPGSLDYRIPGHPEFKNDINDYYQSLVESGVEKVPNVAWCGR